MTVINECPICSSKEFKSFLHCQDHTVSRETFQLIRCVNCFFVMTSPRPYTADIGRYYQSEHYISHTNAAASFIDSLYLLARRYTLNWKLNIVGKYAPRETAKQLLDYGCGTGAFIHHCRANHWKVTGVEPSSSAREIAQSTNPDIELHPDLSAVGLKQFHAITLWHVLEHVPNLDETIQHLKTLLTEHGTMFIAVPNYEAWDGVHYQKYWAGYDVPRHLWHFSQATMSKLLTKHQLQLVSTLPMKLDSFYISMLSEKYIRGKSTLVGMTKAFFNGIISNLRASKNNNYSSIIYVVKK